MAMVLAMVVVMVMAMVVAMTMIMIMVMVMAMVMAMGMAMAIMTCVAIHHGTKAKSARARFETAMKAKGCNSAEDFKSVMKSNQVNLTNNDFSFKLEVAMMELLCGDQAQSFAQVRLLKMMPTERTEKDLGATIIQFELLLKDDASKSAPIQIQEAQKHLLGLLKKIHAEKPDHPKGQVMQFVQTIWTTYQHFLKFEQKGKKLSGAVAMKAICEENALLFKKKELEPKHMQPIRQFSWLVPVEWSTQCKAWEGSMKMAVHAKAKSKVTESKASSSKCTDMAHDAALKMFD